MALVAHLLAVLLICDVATGSIPVPTSQDYTHNVIVDGHDNFHVFWKFDNTTITFEMHVRTTGWVGFGFSPDGGMPGSDMVMGWVTDDGEVVFSDRHATAFAEPVVDDSQDYTLLHGEEADGYTILKFERPIDTCDDQHDWLLTSDTTRVIWSHHTEDPVEGQPIPAHTHRGVKSIRLFSVGVEANPDLGEDVVTYDIRNNNYLIPATHTTYYCLGYKLPELNSKHHMIAYEPVIQAGNEAYVHHVLVYQCRISFNETAHHETGHICYTANMPDEWEYCSSTFIAWAIGGEAFYFPEHAGFSLGSVGDPTFVMVEIHYDNPDNLDNIYDSSGIRIYYTPTLRDYDASLLSIGQQVSPKQVIPPGVEEFRNYGHCLAELTQEGFIDRATGNRTDVNVFAVALHEHLLGTAVSVMHVRDGRELRMLMKDDHYDFNYQEMSKLPREVVLRPGDELLTECVYDSTSRTTVSYVSL
ncbi:DBH-like monooxygenase protein 1 homolog [Ptychodera flava]|uniref:DBH-like monooxygenase protein 1 homolog n=1 Tax=Ptychodera flava TaxID=63121 RepID=UPI003969F3B7